MGYTFSWNHNEAGTSSTVQIPVKISKSVDDNYGISGSLICSKCKSPVKQSYNCINCNWSGTIKDIVYRYDSENEVIYENKQKQDYMKTQAEPVIQVVKEIPISEVFLNIEFLREFYEIHTNENTIAINTISKIHKWLFSRQVALLVSFGYREKNRSGVILPSKNKLVLAEIRDYRLIRNPKQLQLQALPSQEEEALFAVSENKEPEMYQAYVEKLKNNEEIPVTIVTDNTQNVIVEASFLE